MNPRLRTTATIALALFLAASTTGCPKRDGLNRADRSAVENARALTKAGQAREAMDEFEDILKKSPDDLDAHRGLIEAAYYAGQLGAMAERYQKMADGDRPGIGHYGLALVASAKGGDQMAVALRHFERAAEELPDQADVPYRMAKVYMQDGQHAQALPLLERALAKDPDLIGARIASAKCLFELGRGEQAIAVMRPVIGRILSAPDAANARTVAAAVFDPQRGLPVELSAEVNKVTEFLQREAAQPALTALNDLIARYPEQPFLQTLRGLAHSQMGNSGEAVVAFERALALRPACPLTLVSLGDVYLRLEKYAEARRFYEQALGLDPFFLDTYRRLGEMALKLGDLDRAVKSFEQVVLLHPDDLASRHLYAQVLFQAGRLDEAIGAYQTIHAEDEDDLKAVMRLARLYMVLGEREPAARKRHRDQARDYAKEAEELAPDSEAVKQLISELED